MTWLKVNALKHVVQALFAVVSQCACPSLLRSHLAHPLRGLMTRSYEVATLIMQPYQPRGALSTRWVCLVSSVYTLLRLKSLEGVFKNVQKRNVLCITSAAWQCSHWAALDITFQHLKTFFTTPPSHLPASQCLTVYDVMTIAVTCAKGCGVGVGG